MTKLETLLKSLRSYPVKNYFREIIECLEILDERSKKTITETTAYCQECEKESQVKSIEIDNGNNYFGFTLFFSECDHQEYYKVELD